MCELYYNQIYNCMKKITAKIVYLCKVLKLFFDVVNILNDWYKKKVFLS